MAALFVSGYVPQAMRAPLGTARSTVVITIPSSEGKPVS
jgi:hypothetical protein